VVHRRAIPKMRAWLIQEAGKASLGAGGQILEQPHVHPIRQELRGWDQLDRQFSTGVFSILSMTIMSTSPFFGSSFRPS
jgi:hypothetical protein